RLYRSLRKPSEARVRTVPEAPEPIARTNRRKTTPQDYVQLSIDSIGLVSGQSQELGSSPVADVAGCGCGSPRGTAIMSAQPDIVAGAIVPTAGPGAPSCPNPRRLRCCGRSAALVAPDRAPPHRRRISSTRRL